MSTDNTSPVATDRASPKRRRSFRPSASTTSLVLSASTPMPSRTSSGTKEYGAPVSTQKIVFEMAGGVRRVRHPNADVEHAHDLTRCWAFGQPCGQRQRESRAWT